MHNTLLTTLLFLLFSLIPLSFCTDNHLLPRPLIIELAESIERHVYVDKDEIELECTSWRFAVESNNLSPWRSVPEECGDYVREYMIGKGYKIDVDRVSKEAGVYAKSVELRGDGKDVWVFDVDETLLSNLPYYAVHGYGYVSFLF